METQRLYFRKPQETDADFIFSLVNDPSWIQYIGDRKVHNKDDAVRFISESLNAQQSDERLGLRVCCIKNDILQPDNENKDTPVGLCGLLQRDYLDSIDIGYAFSKEYRGFGFAFEAACYFKELAFNDMAVDKLYATVFYANKKSISLLEKLGFKFLGGLVENNVESSSTALYVCYEAED
jgi:RimJ/RimL family protein N-acetyltransferase